MKSKLLLTSLVLLASPLCAAPVISEIVASNSSSLADDDGDFSDWIEIFNPGDAPFSLAGHHLSDDPETLDRWTFPAIEIPAKGYLVVFASGKDRTDPLATLHTSFRLSAGGEYVSLVSPDRTMISEIAPNYPPLESDQSYALITTGDGVVTYATTNAPSPNAENASNVVIFSKSGEAFTDSLTVELTTPSGGSIRYTTDGQAPTLFNGKTYSGPITLTETALISASTGGGIFTTEAFIKVDPELAERSSDIPIVLAVAEGSLNQTTLKDMAIAIVEPGDNGRAQLLSSFTLSSRGGIRTRGETSNSFPKKPLRFEFWDTKGEDRDLAPLGMAPDSDWVLNSRYTFDRTLMHNAWIYELSNQLGQWAPHTRFVELYLNDSDDTITEADYQGVYCFMEINGRGADRVDVERLPADVVDEPEITGGYIFKKDKTDPGTWDINGGSEPLQMVYPDEEERNERKAQGDWLVGHLNEMRDAIRTHGSNPELGYPKYINERSWLDHHMLNFVTNNVDAMRISAYFHKPRGGKVVAGPIWDFDRSAGGPSDGRITNPEVWGDGAAGTAFFVRGNHGTPVWWEDLFANPDFTQTWVDRWYALRQTEMITAPWDDTPLPAFSDASFNRIIDHLADEIMESQVRNFDKWTSARPRNANGLRYSDKDGFEGEIEHLKGWLQARAAWIEEQFITVPTFSPSEPVQSGSASASISMKTGGSLFKPAVVHYTTDGSDPRLPGGEPNPTAQLYSSAFELTSSGRVKARRIDNSYVADRWGPTLQWSGLADSYYFVDTVPASAANLVVSELMYHPAAPTDAEITATFTNDDDFEFIEFYNISNETVDLSGTRLRGDADFNFPDGTVIAAGARAVVVANGAAFAMRHGDSATVLGDYRNRLSNAGGTVRLRDFNGAVMREISYEDAAPWPSEADGSGMSLSLANPESNPDSALASSWIAAASTPGAAGGSSEPGGSGYGAWLANQFTSDQQADAGISGPNADADRDGLPTLAEFVLLGNPLQADANKLPKVVLSSTGDALELQYTRLAGTDATVEIELSEDLQTWTSATAGSVETSTTPGTNGAESVTAALQLGDVTARYARLKFSL